MAGRKARIDPFSVWSEMVRSAAATAATLSVRLPQLASGTMSASERRRMVSEKLAAAGEGAAQASATAARIAMRRGLRPKPHLATADLAEIVEAASRPARRRVKANAERLTKG